MLTLLDQQPGEGHRAAAAQTALTRRTGQPGALDASTADHWAGATATLYNDLNNMIPVPDRLTRPALPFQSRYSTCFPAKRGTGSGIAGHAAKIREWAGDNGYEVAERGRIPAEVREAYAKAN